jgi:hypothetical protein
MEAGMTILRVCTLLSCKVKQNDRGQQQDEAELGVGVGGWWKCKANMEYPGD